MTDLAGYHRGVALDARRQAALQLGELRRLPRDIEWRIERLRKFLLVEQAALAALDAADPDGAARLRKESVQLRETFLGAHSIDLVKSMDTPIPPSPEVGELVAELRGLADRVRGMAERLIGPAYASPLPPDGMGA